MSIGIDAAGLGGFPSRTRNTFVAMRFEQSILLEGSREAVWGLVADTEALNREMGLPPINFRFTPRQMGGADTSAEVRIGGLTLRYREHPFDWVRPSYYHVRRTFHGGPVREIVGGARLEKAEGGTRVVVWSELEPANPVGILACRAIGMKATADFLSAARGFNAFLRGESSTPYPKHGGVPPANSERLEQRLARLLSAGGDPGATNRIAAHVRHAPPEAISMIRPFILADSWGVDRTATLKTMLLAASRDVELLELKWRVLCPSCRGSRAQVGRLADVAAQVHCESCNIRFDSEFDRSVEVCFAVAPAVRAVQESLYCIGGPHRSPHVVAQFHLRPGEDREEHLDLPPGDYALNSLQTIGPLPIVVLDGAAVLLEVGVDLHGKRAAFRRKGVDAVRPDARWTLRNTTPEPILVRVEAVHGSRDVATAAEVTSLQAFRDQFGSEVLAPGTDLAVRQICIFFSDLLGSTAMYRKQGDAPSYRTVRVHFDRMRQIIDTHQGAIVKTIGDAVMATFTDPADGVRAALEVQRTALESDDCPPVKIGLHYGPAIAVNANDRLDYFGQTVNLAARVQAQSQGGEVVISAELAADPAVSALLDERKLCTTWFDATVRGLDVPVRMLRLSNAA
jgi:adenylate cyclase